MRTLFSLARLVAGCFALIYGISWTFMPARIEPETGNLRIYGMIVAALGLAMTLQETAYIHSRFMRSDDSD